MATLQIKCIKKTDRQNAHERIKAIGGANDNSNWTMTQEEAIAAIEQKKHAFYVQVQGKAVNVIVATSRFGNKYIKTESDGEQPNNLLSLMECY
jgi:hypothetical protein